MTAKEHVMRGLVAVIAAALASGVAAAADVPDAQTVLLKAAGLSEASVSAPNAQFEIRLRESDSASWRVVAAVVQANGEMHAFRVGDTKDYITCTTTAKEGVVTTARKPVQYFIGHRIEVVASDCDSTSCRAVVMATLTLDNGLRTEAQAACDPQTPNVIASEARIDRRVEMGAPVRVPLGASGELVLKLGGLDYLKAPGQ